MFTKCSKSSSIEQATKHQIQQQNSNNSNNSNTSRCSDRLLRHRQHGQRRGCRLRRILAAQRRCGRELGERVAAARLGGRTVLSLAFILALACAEHASLIFALTVGSR